MAMTPPLDAAQCCSSTLGLGKAAFERWPQRPSDCLRPVHGAGPEPPASLPPSQVHSRTQWLDWLKKHSPASGAAAPDGAPVPRPIAAPAPPARPLLLAVLPVAGRDFPCAQSDGRDGRSCQVSPRPRTPTPSCGRGAPVPSAPPSIVSVRCAPPAPTTPAPPCTSAPLPLQIPPPLQVRCGHDDHCEEAWRRCVTIPRCQLLEMNSEWSWATLKLGDLRLGAAARAARAKARAHLSMAQRLLSNSDINVLLVPDFIERQV